MVLLATKNVKSGAGRDAKEAACEQLLELGFP